jgi:hypothetical protein
MLQLNPWAVKTEELEYEPVKVGLDDRRTDRHIASLCISHK